MIYIYIYLNFSTLYVLLPLVLKIIFSKRHFLKIFSIWFVYKLFGPASARSYKIGVIGNDWLVGNTVSSETTLMIFLIFCITLRDYKSRKVTEPDFWKRFLIWRYLRKGLQISIVWLVGWLVGNAVFSEMALRIFLIFCMNLGDYKGRKVTEPDFWKKKNLFAKRSPN